MSAEEFAFAEMMNRFYDLICVGSVSEVSEDGRFARILLKGAETPWLPIAQKRSGDDEETWTLSTGEMCVVVSPEGDLAHGLIIATLPKTKHQVDRGKHRTRYADGTEIVYDKKEKKLTVNYLGTGQTLITMSKDGLEIATKDAVTIKAEKEATVIGNEVKVEAKTKAEVSAPEVTLGNNPVAHALTSQCICQFTGLPHPGSQTVRVSV